MALVQTTFGSFAHVNPTITRAKKLGRFQSRWTCAPQLEGVMGTLGARIAEQLLEQTQREHMAEQANSDTNSQGSSERRPEGTRNIQGTVVQAASPHHKASAEADEPEGQQAARPARSCCLGDCCRRSTHEAFLAGRGQGQCYTRAGAICSS